MEGGGEESETGRRRKLKVDVFLFGAGYSARACARLMRARGVPVAGTVRDRSRFSLLRDLGIEPFQFAGEELSAPVRERLESATHMVVSVAPGKDGDPVLRAAASAILNDMPALEWIGYLSTVGVYGNRDGGWVDETSGCRPVSARSRRRVVAERNWIELGGKRAVPTAVLRLAGIYGPGRNAFVRLREGAARRLIKPGQVFNRIHVTDIARAISHLGDNRIGGVFNVTDDEPAPPQDVVAYAAGLMGVEPPPEISFDRADLSPMARSFYGENKRVSNRRLKETGFGFRYADYRESHAAFWSRNDWRTE